MVLTTIKNQANMHNPVSEPAVLGEQTILDSLPVAIIIVDQQGSVHYSNPQSDAIFREKFSDLADFTKLSSTFDGHDFNRAIKKLNKKPAKPFKTTINFDHCQLPESYQLKMVTAPEYKQFQNKHFYLITLTDTYKGSPKYAALKKNFKELKQFSRLSAMREISSSLADQLNQPLTAILTYTQAMQRLYHDNASSKEISSAMERVVINAENAGQIIRNIRAQLNANTLNCQTSSINQLIEQSVHLTELDNPVSRIRLISHFDPLSTELYVDGIQFKQVILSLLNNAIEALILSRTESPEIVLSTRLNDLCYEITIEDNGPGIPEEIRDLLFEPFISTKESGIGIGLSMCHHIIELHKGSINIVSGHYSDYKQPCDKESANQQPGTKVTICLPLKTH